jgi:hypothetical protein
MDGWTAGEDRYMAIWRGEMPYDQPDAPEERESEREEPDETEPEPEPEGLTGPRRYTTMTSLERARARLGSRADCVICQGEECWCAVVVPARRARLRPRGRHGSLPRVPRGVPCAQ